MKRQLSSALLLTVLTTLSFATMSCKDSADHNSDLIVFNASSEGLNTLVVDGTDAGPISTAETRVFNNVSDGVHVIQGYRNAGDIEPCDTFTTDSLNGREDAYVSIHCSF